MRDQSPSVNARESPRHGSWPLALWGLAFVVLSANGCSTSGQGEGLKDLTALFDLGCERGSFLGCQLALKGEEMLKLNREITSLRASGSTPDTLDLDSPRGQRALNRTELIKEFNRRARELKQRVTELQREAPGNLWR